MLQDYNYYCPHCKCRLTMNNAIHFYIKDKHKQKANISLSAAPGVYGYESDVNLEIMIGDILEFYCPSCHANLQSKKYPDFIEIHLIVTENIYFEVLFSPKYGEKITYVIMENEMVKYKDDFFSFYSNRKKAS